MVQVVWFKRDLRIHDHAALSPAAAHGKILPLYIIEPDYWAQPDTSARQYAFLCECLESLQQSLDGKLIIKIGNAVDILEALNNSHKIETIHSHQEIGNAWTYERDKQVARWCRTQSIHWQEYQNFGVKRVLDTRDNWALYWEEFMTSPTAETPTSIKFLCDIKSEQVPTPNQLGLQDDPCPLRQKGGRTMGLKLLQSFFGGRGHNYQKEMSSPLTARQSCSRLSPHLAYGTLSMREVVHQAYGFRGALSEISAPNRHFDLRAVDAFIARLHWHCHFIQKLEDEPQIQFKTFHPAFQDARLTDSNDSKLFSWANGNTGWPFVDACMRSLIATGWINFRMRAMLTAIASYHLWLDWRMTGQILARYFVDYEPGIHWSQIQMQSGTTAINTLRMYNPIKQSQDQDPEGEFIRRWVPELAAVPDAYIHAPWMMPPLLQTEINVKIGEHYPAPIVDHIIAAREARAKITQIRSRDGFRENQLRVLKKHASRKGKSRRDFPTQERMIKTEGDQPQLTLDL